MWTGSNEVVNLFRDTFVHADVQIAVYTLEEDGVHTMSAEGNADNEMERYSHDFFLENRELETDFQRTLNPANRLVRSDSREGT